MGKRFCPTFHPTRLESSLKSYWIEGKVSKERMLIGCRWTAYFHCWVFLPLESNGYTSGQSEFRPLSSVVPQYLLMCSFCVFCWGQRLNNGYGCGVCYVHFSQVSLFSYECTREVFVCGFSSFENTIFFYLFLTINISMVGNVNAS